MAGDLQIEEILVGHPRRRGGRRGGRRAAPKADRVALAAPEPGPGRLLHRYGDRVEIRLHRGCRRRPGPEVSAAPPQGCTHTERLGVEALRLRATDKYVESKANRPRQGEPWNMPGCDLVPQSQGGQTVLAPQSPFARAPKSSRARERRIGAVGRRRWPGDQRMADGVRGRRRGDPQRADGGDPVHRRGADDRGCRGPGGSRLARVIQPVGRRQLVLRHPAGDDHDADDRRRQRQREPVARPGGRTARLPAELDWRARLRALAPHGPSDELGVLHLLHQGVSARLFGYAAISPAHRDGLRGRWVGTVEHHRVVAHETGHIFGCPDEYASSNCTCGGAWGRWGEANSNCENCAGASGVACLMRATCAPLPSDDAPSGLGLSNTDGEAGTRARRQPEPGQARCLPVGQRRQHDHRGVGARDGRCGRASGTCSGDALRRAPT